MKNEEREGGGKEKAPQTFPEKVKRRRTTKNKPKSDFRYTQQEGQKKGGKTGRLCKEFGGKAGIRHRKRQLQERRGQRLLGGEGEEPPKGGTAWRIGNLPPTNLAGKK